MTNQTAITDSKEAKQMIKVSAWWMERFYARVGIAENTVTYYGCIRAAFKAAQRSKRNGASNVFVLLTDQRNRVTRRVEV